jgi:hypothetical protein
MPRQKRLSQRVAALAEKLEPVISGRNNALEFSLRDLSKIMGALTGTEPHPWEVAQALRSLGYERVPDGTGWGMRVGDA